jgi:hypothetical protein
LPPEVLAKIIKKNIRGVLDQKLMDVIIAREDEDNERLRKLVK